MPLFEIDMIGVIAPEIYPNDYTVGNLNGKRLQKRKIEPQTCSLGNEITAQYRAFGD